MTYKLLIDECLSPELVKMAVDAGHVESTCVRDRGLLGEQDWDLVVFVVHGDYTLVTANSKDFRGEGAAAPGGLHGAQEIHAGLICLNSFAGVLDLDKQRVLFDYALAELAELPDLVNQALEVTEAEDGEIGVETYDLPAPH